MASIDYIEAKKEIEKLITANDTGFRKVVFWYDAPRDFEKDIMGDLYTNCRVLVCDKNEFVIKKTIEHEDTTSNILVYIPYERPIDIQNWLLDILMYSEEYYADTVALTMRRLGLTNPDLRRTIEKHAKFFNSAARNKKLSHYILINDEMRSDDFKIAMMATLTKANNRSIEAVLTELVFDDKEKSNYNELIKYGFENFLWEQISSYYNYEGEQKIDMLIKRFLFTAMLEQKATLDNLHSFYTQFIIEGSGKSDAKFFIDRIKTDERYASLQESLALEMRIEEMLISRDMSSVKSVDIFEAIDTKIIKTVAENLKNASLDYDTFEDVINTRINSIWYDKHEKSYKLLSSAISFFRLIEQGIQSGLPANEYIKLYDDSYYKIDTEYRNICVNYNSVQAEYIDIFEGLMDRVELTYQESFLSILGKNFSEAIKEQKSWEFAGIKKTRDFFYDIQKHQYRKMFVIVSDALRYEIGKEIVESVKIDPILGGNVEITPAVSPLPSETRFGMAALLPHNEMQYIDKCVLVDGRPTASTADRDAILKAKNSNYCAIQFSKINKFKREELRSFMADKSLVYIFHNVIDNAGHNNEDKVFDEVQVAINEILALIKKLYNTLQISNFCITADHGFLYRKNVIMESEKYGNIVPLNAIETAKRYLITDENIDIPYTIEMPLKYVSNAEFKVIMPYGYDIFKTQGSGLQFIHGGHSLQEILVPIIRISELRSRKTKDLIGPVGVRLKSVVRKITNRSFALEFEQYEKVEDHKHDIACETYFVDEYNNKVSGEYRFVANSTSDDVETRVTRIRYSLKNIEFSRNKNYFLVLKDADKSDEYIERVQFVVDILERRIF